MKASREELIDFLSWYNDQPYEIRRQLMYPEIVDLYLKSINSEAGNETPTVTDNEHQEKVCEVFSDPQCIFKYCPHPELCKNGGCMYKQTD